MKGKDLWNAVKDFITFFTKYKIYLFYIIILKEIRLSFEETPSV